MFKEFSLLAHVKQGWHRASLVLGAIVLASGTANAQAYCTPSPSSVDGQGITKVSYGTVSNTTGTETGNYGDYTAFSSAHPAGTSFNVTIEYKTGFSYYTWLWLDWNNDSDFVDPGEAYYIGNSSSSNPTSITGTINIPATATVGNYVMRIGGSDNGLGTTAPSDPCYTGTWASFEDYTLEVTAAPTCLAPGNMVATGTSSSSMDVTWSGQSNASYYLVEYGVGGFTPGTGDTAWVYDTTFSASGLNSNTAYDFYFTTICSATDSSMTVGPATGQTLCAAYSTPLVEGFESNVSGSASNPALSDCWEYYHSDAGNSYPYPYAYSSTNSPRSGSKNLYVFRSSWSGTGDSVVVISPQIIALDAGASRLTFYGKKSYSYNPGEVIIGFTNAAGDLSSLRFVDTLNITSTTYDKYEFRMDATSGILRGEGRVALAFVGNSVSDYVYIDDLEISDIPNCIEPSAVAATSTFFDVDLSWSGDTTADYFLVEYDTAGFTPGSGDTAWVHGLSTSISGLNSNTAYDFYVTTICSSVDSSQATGPLTISTVKEPDTACGDLTLELIDSWGDGWNGNTIDVITPSGTTTYTLSSGYGTSYTINVAYQDTVQFMWQGGGNYGYEASFKVTDFSGSTTYYTSPDGDNMTAGAVQYQVTCSTPPPACAAPSGVAINVSVFDASITWNGPAAAMYYLVEYDTTGFTPGTGDTAWVYSDSLHLANLAPLTGYDVYLTSICSATDSSSMAGPYSFQINNGTNCYSGIGPSSSADSEIDGITLIGETDTIASSTQNCSATGLQDYTQLYSADLQLTGTYNLEIQMSSCGGSYSGALSAWIDFNGDGDFDNTEQLGVYVGSPSTQTFQFTIPATATLGNKVLRVVQQEAGSTSVSPCGTFSWGDIEDYMVELVPAPACVSPQNISIVTGQYTASVSWDAATNASSNYIEYGAAGFTPGTGNSTSVTNDSVYISGLLGYTAYDFYIYTVCGTDTSSTVATTNVYTQCVPFGTPYTQDFDAIPSGSTTNPSLPGCWDYYSTGSSNHYTLGYSANSGSNTYRLSRSSADAGDTAMTILPEIIGLDNNDKRVIFYGRKGYSSYPGELMLGVTNANGDASSLRILDTLYMTSDSYDMYSYYLDANSGIQKGDVRLALVTINDSVYDYLYIDDIEISDIPNCLEPTNLTAGGATYTSVDLAWSGDTTVDHFVVEYDTAGFTQGSGDTAWVYGLNTTVTKLSSGATYDFYVYAQCNVGNASPVTGPASASTKAAPTDACGDIVLKLIDSYGDGWNGNTIEVYTSVDTSSYTLSTGSSVSYTVTSTYLDTVQFAWMGGGSYGSEASYQVEDLFGNVLFTSGNGNTMTAGDVQFELMCTTPPPSCAIPTGLSVETSGLDLVVTWDLDTNVMSYTLEYDTAGYTYGNGTTVTVYGDSTVITGLTAATEYDFYIVANCSATDASAASPVASGTTAKCASTDACEYVIELVDTYGDGWDGWEITVADSSGYTYAVLGDGFNSGSSQSHTLSICDGTDIVVSVSSTSLYASEVALNIWKDGTLIDSYAATSATTMGTVMSTFNVNCFAFCATPSNITALEVKSDSILVDVDYNGSTAFVEYGTAGFVPGNGTTLTLASGDTTFWMTGLTANTLYDVMVSQECANGVSSDTLVLEDLQTAKCASTNTCDFTLELVDSYGDGWDGWEVTVADTNGYVYGTFGDGFTTGALETHTVSLCDGDYVQVYVSSTASYSEEVGINVYKGTDLVGSYATGQSPSMGTVMTAFTAVCNPAPACVDPSNLAGTMMQTMATFSWDGDTAHTSYFVEYGEAGFTPGTGDTATVLGTTYSVGGLSPNTAYEFYVTAACGATTTATVGPESTTTLAMPVGISFTANGCVDCESASVGDFFVLDGDSIEVVDRSRLLDIVAAEGDLTKVCVSHVTDMKNVFQGEKWFNQDIGKWDVSNVTTMRGMFFNADLFNQDIGHWDVSAVTDMTQMFARADVFNQDLDGWDVSSVELFSRMFKEAPAFNGAVSNWDVTSATRMSEMFRNASVFNQDLSSWCVAQFEYYNVPQNFETGSALVAEHLPNWGNCPNTYDDVTTLASGAFVIASNGCIDCSALNIGDYFELGGDTLLVVDRTMLDSLVNIRADLSKVCVSNITDMTDALRGLSWFNTDISSWDVSNVTNMNNMFRKAQFFNKDIGNWDVSNVTNMSRMFFLAKDFDSDISGWDVSSVTRMNTMFRGAETFNQDISGWDVSNVFNMDNMFRRASLFSQDLSGWCVSLIASKPTGFDANSSLSAAQLPNWGTCGGTSFVAQSNMQGAEEGHVEMTNTEVTLYPNPTNGLVEIAPVLDGEFKIYNEFGRLIDGGQIRATYDLSDHAAGLYILMLQSDAGVQYLKVVKQ